MLLKWANCLLTSFSLSLCVSQASTIQTQTKTQHKSVGIALTTYHSQKTLKLVSDSQVTPCLYLTLYTILFDYNIIANYTHQKTLYMHISLFTPTKCMHQEGVQNCSLHSLLHIRKPMSAMSAMLNSN